MGACFSADSPFVHISLKWPWISVNPISNWVISCLRKHQNSFVRFTSEYKPHFFSTVESLTAEGFNKTPQTLSLGLLQQLISRR